MTASPARRRSSDRPISRRAVVVVGVLVDTLVLRTVIVPAVLGLGGDTVGWPGESATGRGESAA